MTKQDFANEINKIIDARIAPSDIKNARIALLRKMYYALVDKRVGEVQREEKSPPIRGERTS